MKNMSRNVLFLLLLAANVSLLFGNEYSVDTKNGRIVGQKLTVEGRELSVFLGIPYAQPPIGGLRFKKPLPVSKWSEPVQAKQWPNPCYYMMSILPIHNKNLSEDCLYLNVWSPSSVNENDGQNLKAVMFWIHGGGLIIGSSSEALYNGEVLSALGDVVVVSFNYRLNAFGFFYAGTEEAPGNVGLWDQALALEWVNDNIKYFGGDPNRITIFGESAGGWSVTLHLLSPVSRNLYQNAIAMSGAVYSDSTVISAEEAKKLWLKAAQIYKCSDGDREFTPQIIDCMRNVDPFELSKTGFMNELKHYAHELPKLITIDGVFLTAHPRQLFQNGDYKKSVNLMIGTVGDEGSALLPLIVTDGPAKYDKFNPTNMTHAEAGEELKRLMIHTYPQIAIKGENAVRVYLSLISPNSDDYDLLRRTIGIAIGDYILTCPTLQFGESVFRHDSLRSRVYQYYYNSKLGDEYKLLCSKWMGTCHLNDVWPVFGLPFQSYGSSVDEERDESKQVIEFFSHFAKYGKPSPQNGVDWPPYYLADGHIIKPYFTLTNTGSDRLTYFANDLKTTECDLLWNKYLNS